MWREVQITERLGARRAARKLAASRRGSHPVAHLDPEKVHEWMRSECAVLTAARQAREDKLMDVVIQTSSAALLAIPGFLVASGKGLPSIANSWMLAAGASAFTMSFVCACFEQVLSSRAYKAQRQVVQDYYTQQSEETSDKTAIRRADLARRSALTMFTIAVSLGAFGLLQVARDSNGKPTTTTTTTTAAAAPSTATAAPAASTASTALATNTAGAEPKFRRRSSPEIQPGPNNSASQEKVN
jgi:hypothetical protein